LHANAPTYLQTRSLETRRLHFCGQAQADQLHPPTLLSIAEERSANARPVR